MFFDKDPKQHNTMAIKNPNDNQAAYSLLVARPEKFAYLLLYHSIIITI